MSACGLKLDLEASRVIHAGSTSVQDLGGGAGHHGDTHKVDESEGVIHAAGGQLKKAAIGENTYRAVL
jgi:hypothetical protein